MPGLGADEDGSVGAIRNPAEWRGQDALGPRGTQAQKRPNIEPLS